MVSFLDGQRNISYITHANYYEDQADLTDGEEITGSRSNKELILVKQ